MMHSVCNASLITIGLVTTGGDAPGMNACIRAIVKGSRSFENVRILGIYNGVVGMISSNHVEELGLSHVQNIIEQAGTILGTSREPEIRAALNRPALEGTFSNDELINIQTKVRQFFIEHKRLSALIMLGGNQTCQGSVLISKALEGRIPIIVVPASIDNDVKSTEETIGFDAAVNAAVLAIDAIRRTAGSHRRIFIVEVMGRKNGRLALNSALACGAEHLMIPEEDIINKKTLDMLAKRVNAEWSKRPRSIIIAVAEGTHVAAEIQEEYRLRCPTSEQYNTATQRTLSPGAIVELELRRRLQKQHIEWATRLSILGHIQRGAQPTARTRNLASILGTRALEETISRVKLGGIHPHPALIGVMGGKIVLSNITQVGEAAIIRGLSAEEHGMKALVDQLSY
jgi:6-phosphofructokinase 1